MSFSCDECGYRNNEIQSGEEIQQQGLRLSLKVTEAKDLNRRVVRSDYASVKFEELDFEIPSQSQRGEITTVEGVIERAIRGLEQDQEKRKIENPDDAKVIDGFIDKLKNLIVNHTFTLTIEDISGNCFIENYLAPHTDPNLTISHFDRNNDQNHALGFFQKSEVSDTIQEEPEEENPILHPLAEGAWTLEELHGEVMQFQTNCPECNSPCETNMKVTSIPHFKDVVIMATVCDVCGAKTNEVKSGGGIEPHGTKFIVKIQGREDFSRDVLKSETCSLHIPEIDCDVGGHALNGRFTTVEGLLMAMRDQIVDSLSMFKDTRDDDTQERLDKFLANFAEVLAGNKQITLILDDIAGNSYIQSLSDEGLDDRLKIEKYERSYEQNEELGLNDMKTENY